MRLVAPLVLLLATACAAPEAQRSRSDVLGARRDLARALVARGDLDAALELIQPILAEHPDDAEALALRGIVHRERGLLAEAEADLREALRRDERLALAHSALGIVRDLQGDPAGAETEHRRALSLEPRSPRYLNNLAFSLFAHGRAREAIPLYVEALRADPTSTRLRNNLGYAYAATGDWPRARRQFEAAGSPPEARLHLGYAYERTGQLALALAQYREVEQLSPRWPAARDAAARVAGKLAKPQPLQEPDRPGAASPEGGAP